MTGFWPKLVLSLLNSMLSSDLQNQATERDARANTGPSGSLSDSSKLLSPNSAFNNTEFLIWELASYCLPLSREHDLASASPLGFFFPPQLLLPLLWSLWLTQIIHISWIHQPDLRIRQNQKLSLGWPPLHLGTPCLYLVSTIFFLLTPCPSPFPANTK